MSDRELKQQHHLQNFYDHAESVLDYKDKNYLYNILKEYQIHRQIDLLVECLISALDTPEKKNLLGDIRLLIPESHAERFDEIAPYHEMASPVYLSNKSRRYRSSNKSNQKLQGNDFDDGNLFRTISINKRPGQEFGIDIRGGAEHGLGIFVSDVLENSIADVAGVHIGDNIIEVNDVSFGNIASSSAIKVFNGSHKLRITIKRVGKVPRFRMAREKTSWFDTIQQRMIEGIFQDNCESSFTSGVPMLNGMRERRVNLTITRSDQFLGFNIRGGDEYSLGIYVSKVDHGGLAEQKGIQIGDQIIDVNGNSFEKIKHLNAVVFLKSQRQLVLTVRDVGRYPMFKEMYAHYSWLDETAVEQRMRNRKRYLSSTTNYSSIIMAALPSESDSSTELTSAYVHAEETAVTSEQHNYLHTSNDVDTIIGMEQDELLLFQNVDPKNKDGPMINSEVIIPGENVQYNYDYNPVAHEDKFGSDLFARKEELQNAELQNIFLEDINLPKTPPKNSETSIIESIIMPSVAERRLDRNEMSFTNDSMSSVRYDDEPVEMSRGKVKRMRTFREVVLKKMSFRRKEKAADETTRNKISMRKKNRDIIEDSKSRKSTSTESSGDGTISNGRNGIKDPNAKPMRSNTKQNTSYAMVFELAKKLLNEDEANAVKRHIQRYQSGVDIEAFVPPLLAILDRPEKLLLLREIRDIILPVDLGRFDSMVSRQELEAYEELATRIQTSSHVVIHRGKADFGPPKKTLMAPVPDHRGNFHLKTQEEYDEHRKKKIEVEQVQRQRLVKLQKQISERMDHKPFQRLYAKDDEFPIDIGTDDKKVKAKNPKNVKKVTKDMISEPVYSVVKRDKMKESILNELQELKNPSKPVVATKAKFSLVAGSNSELSPNKEGWGNIYETIHNVQEKLDLINLNKIQLSQSEPVTSHLSKDLVDASHIESSQITPPKRGILKVDQLDNSIKKSLNWGNDCVIDARKPSLIPRPDYFFSDGEHNIDSEKDSDEENISGIFNFKDVRDSSDSGVGPDIEMCTLRTVPDGSENDTNKKHDSRTVLFGKIPTPPPLPHPNNRKSTFHEISPDPPVPIDYNEPPVFYPPPPPASPPPSESSFVEDVYFKEEQLDSYIIAEIPKGQSSLGISISGGADSVNQPDTRIESIHPSGALSQDTRVKAGMLLIEVDDVPVKGLTHHQVVETIRRAYNSQLCPTMKLKLGI